MKAAYVPVCASGHILASLPMAAELVKKGVAVDYFATAEWKDPVEKSGAHFVELPKETSPGDSVENDGDFLAGLPLVFLGMAKSAVVLLTAYLKNHRPDVLIADSLALAGRLAASKLQIPLINMFTSYASGEAFSISRFWPEYDPEICRPRAAALKQARELQETYGGKLLTAREIFDSWADYNIVALTRSFQPEGDKFSKDRYFFAGAQIAPRTGAGTWQPPANGKPLLYTSLGSLFNNWPEFYAMLFEMVKGMDINVLCSLGKVLKPERLGKIPENVTMMAFTPQLEVLAHADYFFTHAGIGSVMEAMHFGLPCFCLPQMDEQEFTAARMIKLGLASGSLTRPQVTAEALRENLLKLMEDSSYRKNAEKQQEEMRQEGGAASAAEAVIRYVNTL